MSEKHSAENDAAREAIDDLWGCIGHAEIQHLQPETIALARENHSPLWHSGDRIAPPGSTAPAPTTGEA